MREAEEWRMLRSKATSAVLYDVAVRGSGVLIAVHHSVGDNVDRDPALRRIDELIDEAVTLREQIAAALVREYRPFFPERRQANRPHAHGRRQFD
jgi:hypothetical protein